MVTSSDNSIENSIDLFIWQNIKYHRHHHHHHHHQTSNIKHQTSPASNKKINSISTPNHPPIPTPTYRSKAESLVPEFTVTGLCNVAWAFVRFGLPVPGGLARGIAQDGEMPKQKAGWKRSKFVMISGYICDRYIYIYICGYMWLYGYLYMFFLAVFWITGRLIV